MENVNEAKEHFAECRKCKYCLQKIDLKKLNEHDCHKNILEINNKNEELSFACHELNFRFIVYVFIRLNNTFVV